MLKDRTFENGAELLGSFENTIFLAKFGGDFGWGPRAGVTGLLLEVTEETGTFRGFGVIDILEDERLLKSATREEMRMSERSSEDQAP